jgi:hypothetical protein
MNIVWGMINLVIGYALVSHVGTFTLTDFCTTGSGFLLFALYLAWAFAGLYGATRSTTYVDPT